VTKVSDVEITLFEPLLSLRSAQAPIFCCLAVMFASLMLHWQLTLHMNFWQLYAHDLLAAVRLWTFGSCTLHHALHLKAVQRANVSKFFHLSMVLHLFTPIYGSQRSVATLWAPERASTTLIMLHTRKTITTCAPNYTDNVRSQAAVNGCTFRLCDSLICSAQACVSVFQCEVQKH